MQIHKIKSKTKRTRSIRVGRGGKRGKTSGRGTKGQKSRAGAKLRPEMRDIIKKIPKLRGRGRNINTPIKEWRTITLASLDKYYKDGEEVSFKTLNEKKLISAVTMRRRGVKIVKTGELSKALNISGVPVTNSVKEIVEKAGGSVKQ